MVETYAFFSSAVVDLKIFFINVIDFTKVTLSVQSKIVWIEISLVSLILYHLEDYFVFSGWGVPFKIFILKLWGV